MQNINSYTNGNHLSSIRQFSHKARLLQTICQANNEMLIKDVLSHLNNYRYYRNQKNNY